MSDETIHKLGEFTGMMFATLIPWIIIFHFFHIRP